MLMDFVIGRKGLLGYLKALGGGNIVKVAPSNGSASELQANGNKRLKVICGSNTSYLDNESWIGDNTAMTFADVRVSPKNSVKPNLGSIELAEALARVLPFTAREDNRPALQCVKFEAREGKLRLVSADGFRLAVMSLDFESEGEALIHRDDLKGMTNALKKASRICLTFDNGGDKLDSKNLILDTELIRYTWTGFDGGFPDYEKLIPTEFNTIVHFDTIEAIKAVNSLKVLANAKAYPIDLTLGDGKLKMTSPDDKGQAIINADTEGEGRVRVDGSYIAEVLKACGGMVDLKLANAHSPMLFSADGYQVVLMPMFADYSKAEPEKAEAEAVTEAEAIVKPATDKPKPKRKQKAKEPVAVA
jgi:DNA polymerase-3 subunit beta